MTDFDFDHLLKVLPAGTHVPNEARQLINRMMKYCKATPDGPWGCGPQGVIEQMIVACRTMTPKGVLDSVMWAQAILESGWFGRPYPIVLGIKATKDEIEKNLAVEVYTRETVTQKELEWWIAQGRLQSIRQTLPDGRHDIMVKDWFFGGKSITDHVKRYAEIIQNRAKRMKVDLSKFVMDASGTNPRVPFYYDRKGYIEFLQTKPAYATGDGYAENLEKIIEQNGLWAMDF